MCYRTKTVRRRHCFQQENGKLYARLNFNQINDNNQWENIFSFALYGSKMIFLRRRLYTRRSFSCLFRLFAFCFLLVKNCLRLSFCLTEQNLIRWRKNVLHIYTRPSEYQIYYNFWSFFFHEREKRKPKNWRQKRKKLFFSWIPTIYMMASVWLPFGHKIM